MGGTKTIQLVTLWFVVLIFIQTGSGSADGGLITAIGIFAIFLAYAIPVTVLGLLVLRFVGE